MPFRGSDFYRKKPRTPENPRSPRSPKACSKPQSLLMLVQVSGLNLAFAVHVLFYIRAPL